MVEFVEQPKNYALNLVGRRKNVYSQHGEDGIIAALLGLIGVMGEGWCCEFGAWDGKHLSNTFNLIKNRKWKGVLIEADEVKYKDLLKTQAEHKENIIAVRETVHYIEGEGKTLDDILGETDIPYDFDVLSVDVDGPDYHIWKSFVNYEPKIVIIEHSGMKGDIIQREGAVHKVDIDGSTSFAPLKQLGEEKGYILIADTGNLIFLHKKYKELIK